VLDHDGQVEVVVELVFEEGRPLGSAHVVVGLECEDDGDVHDRYDQRQPAYDRPESAVPRWAGRRFGREDGHAE
jgi:hypothetical protein